MAETQLTDHRFHSKDLEAFVIRALTAVGLPAPEAARSRIS